MIEKLVFISKMAGNAIRDGFGKQFEIEFKTDASNIVTEIDKKAEAIIIDYIKHEFPSHGILAEESGMVAGASEYTWVVDPIDGTSNFAHGLPIFSVSIGVQKNNETICGVVYDVMRDAMYSAELGSGAFVNNKKLSVSANTNLKESLLVTGFPYDINTNLDYTIEKFKTFLTESRAIRRLGSAAIDLCYVAAGVFDGFWETQLNPWDICAGKLLVEEAGGLVTDFSGNPISIHTDQILATNGKVNQEMLRILNT